MEFKVMKIKPSKEDEMIQPDFQNQGIGTIIMNALLEKCKKEDTKSVQLFSAKGKQNFYYIGFGEREMDAPGVALFL
jgi:GNAT superfamily N-acetyltransferase